jgi:hypothetical protein
MPLPWDVSRVVTKLHEFVLIFVGNLCAKSATAAGAFAAKKT